jgi:outer membrane protein assembly factor BamA
MISCNQTKHVPQEKYLLKKNILTVEGDKLDKEAMLEIIRQQPNRKLLGVKFRLWAYNRETYFHIIKSDSTTIANKRFKQNQKLFKKNQKRRNKQNRINDERIVKAKENGDSLYYEKIIPLKDSINPTKFFREWFKYKIGEPPAVFDSAAFDRSVSQLNSYLNRKGYYFGNVKGDLDSNLRKRKITAIFKVETGKPYYIDSLIIDCQNSSVNQDYKKFRERSYHPTLVGEKLDSDMLSNYKFKVAKYMRDNGYYGFSPAHVLFSADSTGKDSMRVDLTILFTDRFLKDSDEKIQKKQAVYRVRKVYFHLADTLFYKQNFREDMARKGRSVTQNNFLNTLDTIFYNEIKMTRKQKKAAKIPLDLDTLVQNRKAIFLYNTKPFIRPSILEMQNYLEEGNFYKEYYLERSYSSLYGLGVFQSIKPELIELEGKDSIDVHYYLVPAEKQSYSFEPRFTNSNSFLGLSASINYNNKNLFRGSEKMTISLGGGFESTPAVFEKNLDGKNTKYSDRAFNTFEYGPSIQFDLPGLFPIPFIVLTKRQRPRTILSLAYNFQKRYDFNRGVFQFNYLYKFVLDKTQTMQIGLPFASVVKFVSISNRSDAFVQKLEQSNDLFLRNAYSDQFIWQDFKMTFEYNNRGADNPKRTSLFYSINFDHAGLLTSWISSKIDTVTLQKTILGVPYSQFARLDNEVIIGYPIDKKTSFNFRFVAGAGLPYGNKNPSLPYDYGFFAGGSNDNRGWRARSLGPGTYKYYLDTTRTETQIGDLRLSGSAEFRFSMSKLFKGAFFLDAANIWTLKEDVNRIGSQFSGNFYKQLALSAGFGLRLDFSFFVIRLDLGIPLNNPALPDGARWIFQSRQPYYKEGFDKFGSGYKSLVPKPFTPSLNFGIGYPF